MAWVRLDDGFVDHPKIARVGSFGAWLQIQALCYANRNLTDGFVPQDVAESFASRGVLYIDEVRRRWRLAQTCGAHGRDVVEADWPAIMVRARLWESVPGGYRIHDYKDYQLTRADVLALRRGTAARMKKLRAQRRRDAEESSCDAVTSPLVTPSVTRLPVPDPRSPSEVDPSVVVVVPRARRARTTTTTTIWPQDFHLTDERRALATGAGLDAATEWNTFRDFNRARGTRFANWDDGWRLWLRRGTARRRQRA